MRTRLSLAIVCVWCVFAAAVSGQEPSPSAAAAGNVENGRRLYMSHSCYYCHGTVGQGGSTMVGVRIAQVPRSLESFTRYVRRPTARMSAFSEETLPDAGLADIYAYLRSLPAARPARDIALLEAMRRK